MCAHYVAAEPILAAGPQKQLSPAPLSLTWVFTVEFMIRLPVMGAVRFWAEPFNRLDAFVVITSQVELWMAWLGGGEGGAMSGLRAFRLLRILRSLKLINNVG